MVTPAASSTTQAKGSKPVRTTGEIAENTAKTRENITKLIEKRIETLKETKKTLQETGENYKALSEKPEHTVATVTDSIYVTDKEIQDAMCKCKELGNYDTVEISNGVKNDLDFVKGYKEKGYPPWDTETGLPFIPERFESDGDFRQPTFQTTWKCKQKPFLMK